MVVIVSAESWAAMFSGWVSDDGLDKPVAHPLHMLLEEHGPELLQTGRRILQRADDRFPLVDLEREHLDVLGERTPEAHLEVLVVDQMGEFQHESVGDRKAGEEHASSVDASGAWRVSGKRFLEEARLLVAWGYSLQVNHGDGNDLSGVDPRSFEGLDPVVGMVTLCPALQHSCGIFPLRVQVERAAVRQGEFDKHRHGRDDRRSAVAA